MNLYLRDASLNKNTRKDTDAFLDLSSDRWYSYTSTTETMRSWPKIISTLDDVPSFFKDYFYIESNNFPYTILIPEDIVFVHLRAKKTNPKLISLYNDKIIILEKTKKGIIKKYHNFYRINYLKIESILLYSSIQISSIDIVSKIYFNSIREDFFKQINEKIRKYYIKTDNKKSIKFKDEIKLSEYYSKSKINYKFMNYGIKSLLPGQTIKKFIYQEPINIKKFKNIFLNWFYNYTTPMLLILNEDELIIIEEPIKINKNKKNEYGVIFTYIPLVKIKNIAFEKSDYIKMNIELLNNEIISLYFTSDKDIKDFIKIKYQK